MRVLITGAFGWTAQAIVQELHDAGHEIIGLDLPTESPHPEVAPIFLRTIHVNVTELQHLIDAGENVDAIVHLAVAVGKSDYENPDIPFATNVRGTYNILESARLNAVNTVVLMSSAPVHLTWPSNTIVNSTDLLMTSSGDDHLYDLTKRLQEDIARDYCSTYGMNVITLRAGHIVDGRASKTAKGIPLGDFYYCRGGWICRYDLSRAVLGALTYGRQGYSAFHIIGDRRAYEQFQVEDAQHELGIRFKTDFSENFV